MYMYGYHDGPVNVHRLIISIYTQNHKSPYPSEDQHLLQLKSLSTTICKNSLQKAAQISCASLIIPPSPIMNRSLFNFFLLCTAIVHHIYCASLECSITVHLIQLQGPVEGRTSLNYYKLCSVRVFMWTRIQVCVYVCGDTHVCLCEHPYVCVHIRVGTCV